MSTLLHCQAATTATTSREDAQGSAVSILAVEAPAAWKIKNINIMRYFNYLHHIHISYHYVNAAMSIGMGGA
jgi:hypothetical protein